jgi:hypothetical protein
MKTIVSINMVSVKNNNEQARYSWPWKVGIRRLPSGKQSTASW